MSSHHLSEADLALYGSQDLGLRRRLMVRIHLKQCDPCRLRLEQYLSDRKRVVEDTLKLPDGLDWGRLASEMTANIRVGLAAGECVAPRPRKIVRWGWRPAAVVAGAFVLMTGAWWLNMPASDTQSLERAMHGIFNSGNETAANENRSGAPRRGSIYRGTMVEASAAGITLHENGSSLGVSQGAAQPLAVSISVQGSASARYVDADTGQITITSVYTQ